MISIRRDKEIISVEGWNDVERRSAFVTKLDGSEHKLAAFIGSFNLQPAIPCGLADCGQAHAKGHIIRTNGGLETTIGNACGKKYFGVDFDTLKKQFDREATEQANRMALQSFYDHLDSIDARIRDLREGGLDLVYKKTRPLIGPTTDPTKNCPRKVLSSIDAMIKARNPVLSKTREATVDEIQSIEARETRTVSKPHYIQEPIAEIAGIQALYPENDLKKLLITDLQVKLGQFRQLNIEALTYEELSKWAKWIKTVEPMLTRVSEVLAYGYQLLKTTNLSPFLSILERKDARQFCSYLNSLAVIEQRV